MDPCPFCRGTKTNLMHFGGGDTVIDEVFFGVCNGSRCLYVGPRRKTALAAINAWNKVRR